ncbi:MAG: aminotransferase class I/II-fold pyridoxal phosphate-dependent enzyme [Actinomycetota bacterium]|nr:aminotransferase class I/II-fold pyridoxal phosphate-dependent enzyme [Actinomycetota bacterium]
MPGLVRGVGATEIGARIEAAIQDGLLQPGARLPTVRRLAADLAISPTTVSSAYRTLRTRGAIVTEGRAGTRVAPAAWNRSPLVPEVPGGLIDLADGNPDPELLPDLTPVLRQLDVGKVLYGREPNLADLVDRFRAGFAADGIVSGSVAIVGGARDGIERVLACHLRPGDRVAVEDPAFVGILELMAAMRFRVVPVAVDDDGPQPEALDRALGAGTRAVIVTPRAQNPTGAALTRERAAELRAVLDTRPEVVLVEDDHAGPVADAAAHTLSGGNRRRWATVRSLSKYLSPDLRLAPMTGDADTISSVEDRQLVGPGWVTTIVQHLVRHLLDDPAIDDRVLEAKRTYTVRRTALLEALAERGIAASGKSGTNVWVPVKEETGVVTSLARAGWAVAPGEPCRIAAPPGIRITTAILGIDLTPRLADDIAEALTHRRRIVTV